MWMESQFARKFPSFVAIHHLLQGHFLLTPSNSKPFWGHRRFRAILWLWTIVVVDKADGIEVLRASTSAIGALL